MLAVLLLRCLGSYGRIQESSLLASCEEQPGNLLLQKHAAAHFALPSWIQPPFAPEDPDPDFEPWPGRTDPNDHPVVKHPKGPRPWDRRTYLVANSHKGGTEMLRNVMRRAFTVLGANHSCKQNWDKWDLPLTPVGGQHWCMNDSAPVRYENGNKALTINRLRKEGPMRGVMMIRDPMNMLVSAYTYHHRGQEIGRMGVPESIKSLGPEEGVPLCSHIFEHTIEDMVGAYEARGDDMFVARFEDWTRSAEDFDFHVAKMMDFLFGDDITKEERAAILKDVQKEDANGPYGLTKGLSVFEDHYLAQYNITRSDHTNSKDSEEDNRIGWCHEGLTVLRKFPVKLNL